MAADPFTELRTALHDAACRAPAEALPVLVAAAMLRCPRPELSRILSGALAELEVGMPDPPLGGLRAEATWWAEVATEAELAAVVAAGLGWIDPRRFALAEGRRLLAATWSSLPIDDRRAFIERVAPGREVAA